MAKGQMRSNKEKKKPKADKNLKKGGATPRRSRPARRRPAKARTAGRVGTGACRAALNADGSRSCVGHEVSPATGIQREAIQGGFACASS